MTINIYLSNLARYTEGRENGRWLQLPMESAKLEKVFAEIVGQNQEHIILDYNAHFEIPSSVDKNLHVWYNVEKLHWEDLRYEIYKNSCHFCVMYLLCWLFQNRK